MTERRAPENTEKWVHDNPLLFLAEAAATGPENAIVNQEASGQRSFINSDTLPTEMDSQARAILEGAGVQFYGPVDGDELFQYVDLPPGWKKVPTDHPMWSRLLDGKGRERAAIFYKAAFYDRNAWLSLTARFHISFDYPRYDADGVGVAHVMDQETQIYTTNPVDAAGRERYLVSQEAIACAEQWLEEHFSDWRNPGAYWD